MKNIVDSYWFTGFKGSFGIVIVDDGYNKKAYIGESIGLNEKGDAEAIANWGGPIHDFSLEEILNHIKNNK